MNMEYAVVAGPNGILSEYSTDSTIMQQHYALTQQIILKLIDRSSSLPNTNGKSSFTSEFGFTFHCYVSGYMSFYVVSTDAPIGDHDSPGNAIAFAFLDDIRLAWISKYKTKGNTAIQYGMPEFQRILASKMDFYSGAKESMDKMRQVRAQIELVRVQLLDNVKTIIERGEGIDRLITKTEELQSSSLIFQSKTIKLERQSKCKNLKLMIVVIGLVFISFYAMAAVVCKDPLLTKCFSPNHHPNATTTDHPTEFTTNTMDTTSSFYPSSTTDHKTTVTISSSTTGHKTTVTISSSTTGHKTTGTISSSTTSHKTTGTSTTTDTRSMTRNSAATISATQT
eukprot:TRINITY_DN1280_c0_g1_i4.p1 TRINITY_DN1280_c0_g1~~TRINITY_DN1280_c0_g1_i4.p1  ORF type:complete len:339 (+),score=31.44 TRINITY_DN1280_c0_g1_i4:30-1046(+)